MDPHAKLSISSAVTRRELGATTVLLDLADGTYFQLGGVGPEVWRLLQDAPRSIAELCTQLERTFAVDIETLRADVTAFVAELLERRLLIAVSETEPATRPR